VRDTARRAVESARFTDLAFNNIESPGTNRSIGVDDSEGPLFQDQNGNVYPIWTAEQVGGGTDVTITGGSGAASTPITIAHADTSTQGNVSAGGGAAITDVNLDGRGHVTSLGTTDFDGRWVDESGDTMSGTLTASAGIDVTGGDLSLESNRLLNANLVEVFTFASTNDPNPIEFSDASQHRDDVEAFYGSNDDFGFKYESSSDELVLSDGNGVELLRQPKAGPTQFLQGADMGSIEAPEDSYTQIINAPVTGSAAAGDRVGYTLALDNQTFLAIDGEADGSGGIQNTVVRVPNSNIVPDAAGNGKVGTSSDYFASMHSSEFVTHSPTVSENIDKSLSAIREYAEKAREQEASMELSEMVSHLTSVVEKQQSEIAELKAELS